MRRTQIDMLMTTDLDEFRSVLEQATAQACVLILDACHSGIGRDVAGMDPEFERHVYLQAAGTATLAACKEHQVTYEHHATAHGAFTRFLLEGLRGAAKQPNKRLITFQDLNNYVTDQLKRWCIEQRRDQQPNAQSQLVGDPVLIEVNKTLPAAIPATNPFGATLAIREPERFIGRTAELRQLQNRLQYGSVALIGEPKIGKPPTGLLPAIYCSGKRGQSCSRPKSAR